MNQLSRTLSSNSPKILPPSLDADVTVSSRKMVCIRNIYKGKINIFTLLF